MLTDPATGSPVPPEGVARGLTVHVGAARPPSTLMVTLEGELDLASAAQLRETLGSIVGRGHLDVAVDVRGVSFCDAAGLGALRRAEASVRAAGGRLTLHGPCPPLQTLLDLLEPGLRLAPPLVR